MENSEKIINPIWVIINIKTGRLLNSNKKFTNITYDGWIDTLPNKKLEYSGDAALIKYDEKKLTTTVIRDYFGIHQVFYVIKNNKVHISTSITGLVQSGLKIKPSVKKNILFVASHYRYFEFPENSSFFEDVYSLRPGECLIVKNGKITKKKHFSVKIIKSYEKYEMKELGKVYIKLLENSVKKRLKLSSNPVFSLSSGMDSSTVIGIAKKFISEPKIFTTIFNEKTEHDESTEVIKTAKELDGKLFKILIKPDDVLDNFENFNEFSDEPCATITQMMHKIVSTKLKKMGFNLIFSGLGGDEAHCGEIEEYLYYFADLKFLELEEKFNEDLVGWKKYHSTKEYPKNKKILNIFFNSQINFSKQGEVLLNNERYEYNFDILNRDIEINDIIKPKLRNPFKSYLLNKLYQDLYFEAIPVVLKAEMASARSAKIPTVYPYLDPNIMNFSFSLPLKFRYNNGISKYFLREITKNIVPNTARKNYLKKGWNAPFDQWLRKKIKSEILDLINSQDVRNRGIYNLTAIKKKLDQHLKNEKNYAMLLWQFLSYEKWYQSWK